MTAPQTQTAVTVQVRFFASLRERLGLDDRRVTIPAGASVADVWRAAVGDSAPPPNTLTALNLEYVGPEAVVHDGDEVAFFPPVTGG
ncbi:MAG: MoaD/ThiS family protein [Gammaproteobacteria bacterium]